MKENEMIKIASKIFRIDKKDVLAGAGVDDCAVVRIGGKNILLTADCVHEKTDFPPGMLPEEMGHTALAVNLSDIAGCGGKPLYFVFTITLGGKEEFERILLGMNRLARKYDVAVVGGDIDSGNELSISGFAVGVAERYIMQRGSKIGDKVCITGLTGKAQLSLEQLESGMRRDEIAFPDALYKPEPRIKEGIELSEHANAMTDISDSLAVSLNLIAEKSGVRILIKEDLLELSHLTEFVNEKKALELFLYSGGDYELVYLSKKCTHGFEIGEVVEGSGVWIRNDGLRKIGSKGYVHF
ncbi:MAG TPA: thiamine-phosphate kinase [Archaeoglobaceae archaeon]|nr:thiamine-phosphate kinase [Archaeoglobaceae archaeon]